MSERVQRIKVELQAEDQSEAGFRSFTGRLREMQREQRASGEGALERTLRGGGVLGLSMFAVEGAAKGAEALKESIKGTMTLSEGWGHVIKQSADAIPLLGGVVKAFGSIGRAANDSMAAIDRRFGVNEDFVEQHVEDADTVRERYERSNKAYDEARKVRLKLQAEADTAEQRGSDRLLAEEDQRHATELKAFRDEKKKELAELDRFSEQYRKTDAEWVAAEEALDRRHQSNRVQIQRDGDERVEAAAQAHATAMKRLASASRAESFHEAGLTEDAQAEAIKAAASQAIDARDKRMAADLKADPKHGASIIHDAQAEVGAIIKAELDAIDRTYRDSDRQREAEARQNADGIRAVRVAAAAERLRMNHEEGAAEMFELKERHEQQLREIERWQADRLRRLATVEGPAAAAERFRVMRATAGRRTAEDEKYGADVDATLHREGDAKADKEADAQREHDEARLDMLRAMGDAGNALAKREADRLEITTRTEAKIAAITRELREQKDLTPSARKNLEDTVKLLRQGEAIELADAARHTGDEIYRAAPGGEAGSGIRGYAAAAGVAFHNDEYRRQQAALHNAHAGPKPPPAAGGRGGADAGPAVHQATRDVAGGLRELIELVKEGIRQLARGKPPTANAFRW
jgi:hypothetical protein